MNSLVKNESLVFLIVNFNVCFEKVDRKEFFLFEICIEYSEMLIIFCRDCKLLVCMECVRIIYKEYEWI